MQTDLAWTLTQIAADGADAFYRGPIAEKIAADILRAVDKKKNTLYTPIIWWPVMTVIKSIPESIFKKLKI